MLGARHPPRVVLTAHEAALPVARVSVREIGRRAIDAGAARLLIPAHNAIIRDIAPQQAARISEIDRPLAPPHPGREPLHTRQRQTIFREAGIETLDRRVWITLARLPTGERPASEHHCRRCAHAGKSTASCKFHHFVLPLETNTHNRDSITGKCRLESPFAGAWRVTPR